MRILFWGTPDFALPPLRALLGEGYEVVGVVTQPDRPAGRGRKLRPSPVKALALEEGIPVLTPERPRGPDFMAEMEALAPDLSVVVAYGHILRPEVLELPPLGSLNIHASLLPELRGAAPIHAAIVRGHPLTGITLMRMSEGMDEGPILLQRTLPISEEDTQSGLTLRLSELGAEALLETLALLEELEPREQDHARATYAPRIHREDARIDWTRSARQVADHVRGMDAVPGAWTAWVDGTDDPDDPDGPDRTDPDGAPLKLFSPRVVSRPAGTGDAAPGTRIGEPFVVATGEGGAVAFDEVQPAGKRRMPAEAWARGR
jgi:methionyl-tRNA formyltransferase